MRLELIVIGNEVLAGQTVNTNLATIGKFLGEEGYALSRETVLTDDHQSLLQGFTHALERSDLVIATGGLGPTLDDITRKAAAEIYDSSFHYDETVADALIERFGHRFPTIKDQATVPSKAKVLHNPVGTAPGLIFEGDKGVLILLPGVPSEMRPLFSEQVIPYLCKKFPLKEKVFRKGLHIFELPEHAVDNVLRVLQEKYPRVDFGIYPCLGIVSVTLSVFASDEKDAEKQLHPPFIELEREFATNCFESETGFVEEAIQHLFIEKEWTLSCAESCTGGALSASITQHPGSSEYFLGSVISYANSIKTDILGVPALLIEEKGAVSEEVVLKMAEGALKLTGSDFSLAVSGIAGPSGGTEEKPVGTVWCAIAHRDAPPKVWKVKKFLAPRHMIITRSVNALLSNLLIYSKSYNA